MSSVNLSLCKPISEMPSASKTRRKSISIKEKGAIVARLECGESNAKVASEFGVSHSTVSTIWKNKQRIIQAIEENTVKKKKLRNSHHSNLDKCLLDWLTEKQNQNTRITGNMLREKANEFARVLGKQNFQCSLGWITRFRSRHNITFEIQNTEEITTEGVNSCKKETADVHENNEICKLCFKENENLVLLHGMQETEIYADSVKLFIPEIKIPQLPVHLCDSCYTHLKAFGVFRQLCTDNYRNLQDFSQANSKEFILKQRNISTSNESIMTYNDPNVLAVDQPLNSSTNQNSTNVIENLTSRKIKKEFTDENPMTYKCDNSCDAPGTNSIKNRIPDGNFNSEHAQALRKDLTLGEKIALLDQIKGIPPNTSLRRMAEITGVPKSTVSRLINQQSNLRNEWALREGQDNKLRKRKREGKYPDVDRALSRWFSIVNGQGMGISRSMLKVKSEEIAKILNHNEFRATDGWLTRWKYRHAVKLTKSSRKKYKTRDKNIKSFQENCLNNFEHHENKIYVPTIPDYEEEQQKGEAAYSESQRPAFHFVQVKIEPTSTEMDMVEEEYSYSLQDFGIKSGESNNLSENNE